MTTLLYILASTLIVSLIAFIGIIALSIKGKMLQKILLILVSLSAGALMGGAFLHLIPEAIENYMTANIFIYILIGFAVFFFIEKILHWRHCHMEKCTVHTFAYMNLFGDGVHNFIDGLIIAAGFAADINLGIITAIAVAIHEIPQEISDFGVLVYGGFKKIRALFMNFGTAVLAIVGGIVGYLLSGYTNSFVTFLLPFAAGGFIYVAASDLIPEIKKEIGLKKSIINFLVFIIGILVIYGVRFI